MFQVKIDLHAILQWASGETAPRAYQRWRPETRCK